MGWMPTTHTVYPWRKAPRHKYKDSWGLQPASGLRLRGGDVSSWRPNFPETVNKYVKVGDTSALAPAFLAWSA